MFDRNRILEDLADSADLLSMVERLSAALAVDTQDNENIPWAGLKLTLSQVRKKVLSAHAALATGDPTGESHVAFGGAEVSPPTPANSTRIQVPSQAMQPVRRVGNSLLASRIHMSPVSSSQPARESVGRTREIGAVAAAD